MKTLLKRLVLIVGLLSTLNAGVSTTAFAQSTAFTYQGRLDSGGSPASGSYDFRFAIFDAASGGTQVAGPLTNAATSVSNGLFTVTLDFGAGVFPGADRWLEIGVRTNGTGGFTTLTPRQRVTSAPYAIRAASAGSVAASGITGTLAPAQLPAAVVTNAATGVSLTGTFTGNGAGLTNLPAWQLGGNAGTSPGVNFLGTTDNQAFEVRVNNQRALRLEPNTNNAPNVIGGYAGNFVSNNVVGATIAGGGVGNLSGQTHTNQVLANFGTVGGGVGNTASGFAATVAGGYRNTASDWYATVGGGDGNTASRFAATVGGGYSNSASGNFGTVGGGDNNTASALGATVGGGRDNTASGPLATVGGGNSNSASGYAATVGGGYSNSASGDYATVGGGRDNIASGQASFAAGNNARALHDFSFVWSSYPNPSPSFADNMFFVNAPNGLGINCGAQRPDGGGQYWMNLGRVAAGGQLIETSVGATLTLAGVWQNASDQHRKTDFADVDCGAVLQKVLALPVRQWRFTNEVAGVRHLGPTAQDFHAAFGLGEDERSIGTVDADGVALAAIQGLNEKVEVRSQKAEARMQRLEAENEALKAELAELKQLVRSLAGQENGGAR